MLMVYMEEVEITWGGGGRDVEVRGRAGNGVGGFAGFGVESAGTAGGMLG